MDTFTLHLSRLAVARKYEARVKKMGGTVTAFGIRGCGGTVSLPRTGGGTKLGTEIAMEPCASSNGYVTVSFPGFDDETIAQHVSDGSGAKYAHIVSQALAFNHRRGTFGIRDMVAGATRQLTRMLDETARTCLLDVLEPAAKNLGLKLVINLDDVYFRLPHGIVHWNAGDSEVEPWERQRLADNGLDNALDALRLTLPNDQTMAAYIAGARKRGVL